MRHSSGLGLIAALCLPLVVWNAGQAEPDRGLAGRADLKHLGVEGLSALWMAPDGSRMMAVSDRGMGLSAKINRAGDGAIQAVELLAKTRLTPPTQNDRPIDSEGLAIGPDGAIYISTEGPARVLQYEGFGGPVRILGRNRDFGRLPTNGALESLALAVDGTLYTIPETATGTPPRFAVYALNGADWAPIAQLVPEGDFLPVDASIGPDGRLYILFRSFNLVGGFGMQLQRFAFAGGGLGPPETLLETPLGHHGNLEGLSVWRDDQGHLVASMITDDNGLWLQDAELVEYRLPD